MGRKTKRKLLNLILLNVPGLGHAQERFSPPCSPLDNLSQPKRKVFGRSPTFIRPRSVLSFFLAKQFLTSSYSIKEGSGRLLSYVVRELGWSCLFFSQNLVISNLYAFTLNHPLSIIRGYASQLSRPLLEKRPWYVQLNSFSSLFTSIIDGHVSVGHGHQSTFASFIWLWPCDYLWRFPQTFFTLWPLFPSKSSLELFKSSYASTARAFIDHQLVREFSKLVFKHDSLLASTDSPSLASFSKSNTTLENSWSPYLYVPCNVLFSVCMNSPFLRF
ncbi:hypothetical protein AtEden1_Chr4g0279531 [Arabidopsis thaliana]